MRLISQAQLINKIFPRLSTILSKKVDKEQGKGLSAENFTSAEKEKLGGVEDYATHSPIDTSLTLANYAADARVVGLLLNSLSPHFKVYNDTAGIPSIFVNQDRCTLDTLIAGAPEIIHPAFLLSERDDSLSSILIGKYEASLQDGVPCSLGNTEPTTGSLTSAITKTRTLGNNYHIVTAPEWGLLALLAKKRGTLPYGNNDRGKDYRETEQIAEYIANSTTVVKTGTGPNKWSDTWDSNGIFDLNGNRWEIVSGIRLLNGELQLLPLNDGMTIQSQEPTSPYWKALNSQATSYDDLFISPGDANSVKVDWVDGIIVWTTEITHSRNTLRCNFRDQTTQNLSPFCILYLQALAILPDPTELYIYEDSSVWIDNNDGEFIMTRGGSSGSANRGGIFALSLNTQRQVYLGYRIALSL